MPRTIEFWSYPQNCGDGSVYVRYFHTKKAAEKYEEKQDEGWGECCVSSVTLILNDDGSIVINGKSEDEPEEYEEE